MPICTPAELEQAEITGRILVFYGDMAQTELATKGDIYVSDRDRTIIQLLEEQLAPALDTLAQVAVQMGLTTDALHDRLADAIRRAQEKE